VRGLKPQYHYHDTKAFFVAPHTGAWIETLIKSPFASSK